MRKGVTHLSSSGRVDCSKSKQAWRGAPLLGVVALLVGALLYAACDPGATVTYVNRTDVTITVEVNDGGGLDMAAHSEKRISSIGLDDDPYVVTVRDEEGRLVYHEETTFGEIKKRGPIVIDNATPSPAPP
jgi:hypothetical protein